MRNVVQLCLASNNILLVRKWKHAFLWSLLRENGTLGFPKIFIQKQARWLNEKTIIALSYRKISWFVSVSLINYLPQPSASVNNWPTRYRQITIFCSISSNRLLMSVQTQDVLNVAEAFIALLSFSVIDVKTSYNRIKRKIAAFAITVACEQALLFGRAKRVAREGASPLACLSRASRASTFHDIPQMESLLAGYNHCNNNNNNNKNTRGLAFAPASLLRQITLYVHGPNSPKKYNVR